MVVALRDCGLLKYFRLSRMRQQLELLQFLVHSWDPTEQVFHIGDKVLPILINDIYFLTRLLRCGAPISLSGFACGGESARDYIRQFCWPGTQPSKDGKINIRDVRDMPLQTILFTITKLAGSMTLHVVNRSYMQYAFECLEQTMFNQCEEVFSLMKEQLTKIKSNKMKNFSYGSILITFTLERIPLMQPQHVTLSLASPRDPHMQRQVELMARHAGQSSISFSTAFFSWLCQQHIVIEEHPYVGMDFHRDLDLRLPVGAQWGAIGKLF